MITAATTRQQLDAAVLRMHGTISDSNVAMDRPAAATAVLAFERRAALRHRLMPGTVEVPNGRLAPPFAITRLRYDRDVDMNTRRQRRCGDFGNLRADGRPCTQPLSSGRSWCGQCRGQRTLASRLSTPQPPQINLPSGGTTPVKNPSIKPPVKSDDRTPTVDLVLWTVGVLIFMLFILLLVLLLWISAVLVAFSDLLLFGWLENRRRRRRRSHSTR